LKGERNRSLSRRRPLVGSAGDPLIWGRGSRIASTIGRALRQTRRIGRPG